MIVYHGATLSVRAPDTSHSFRTLDFGRGFYVTTNRDQAERWARRKADFAAGGRAVVNEYLMSEEGFQPWGKSIGAYSPNPAFTVNEGDLTIDVWKDALVVEDAEYILESLEVEDFILQHCQG